jgi:hypothetical protein
MVTLSRTAPLLAAALLAVSAPIGTSAAPQSPAVAKLLAEARQALGGDASRASIRSFKITGSLRTSDRSESGSFEIVSALPDKFLQIENWVTLSAGQMVSEPSHGPSIYRRATRLGFRGDRLIFQPDDSPAASFRGFPLTLEQTTAAMTAARTGFANLTLALFAESFSGVPLRFSEAAGPDSANSIQVTGPNIAATLTLNRKTRLPERFGRMRYDDYRDVSGRKIPFRITDGHNKWHVQDVFINVMLPEKLFQPTGPRIQISY